MNKMINIYLSVVILNKGLTCLPLRSLFIPALRLRAGSFIFLNEFGYWLRTRNR